MDLAEDRLLHMQSVLTNTIYADELKEIYIQKDVAYKEVTEAAREIMRDLVDRMDLSLIHPHLSKKAVGACAGTAHSRRQKTIWLSQKAAQGQGR